MTVVVNDEEKAHVMRQAGTRKTTAARSAVTASDDIRTGAMEGVPG
jgi:hypothetical protein